MSAQQHRASRCVFVGNIPYDATEEQLVQICEEVGPVVSFRLVVDRDTGKPKGYGFCEFRDEETALSARRNLQGYEINGRQLRVDFAENEKGGGGVDRNREQQGRGGPGFQQQSGSHLDVPKQGGSGGPQSGYATGHNQFEQPIGRQAASAAAMVMAGALGGTQQVPNVMMQGQGPIQGQGPMQGLNVSQVPMAGNGGLAAGPDALTNHLAGMSKQQLYAIMSEMKVLIQQDQMQARQILVANPQLTKALFQAQIMLGMVRPQQGVASQPPQTQILVPPQQPVMQQPPPPRGPQPHPPPLTLMQPQPTNKSNFQPPMLPSQPQQQQLQQSQAPSSQQQQQQQLPPPPPQGSFQGGLVQTSMGMGFQQGPPPPPPNQLPPQQIYQMGSNMMGANLPRMSANSSGTAVNQGNGGVLAGGGTMGAAGTGQMARGPTLGGGQGGMDTRGMQLNHGLPPSTGAMAGISGGVPGQVQVPMQVPGSMPSGHSLVSGNGGGMGQSVPGNLTGGQLIGDPNNSRGYPGLNTGMNAQMNTGMNQGNTGLNAGMNPGMNPGMPQGLIQGFNSAGMNPAINTGLQPGMNPGLNTGLQSNVNAGMNTGMNPVMTMGLNAPQVGGFPGATDGSAVTSAALQPQGYNQLQAAPAPQQPQGQVPLELEQQKALLQQVMNLTTEQIMSLPPDQRQQVLQLQQALR
ncbi:unnamed protein product [Calypogeia fissa]